MSQHTNPFDEIERFFQTMSRQFEESTHGWEGDLPIARWTRGSSTMPMDLIDNEDSFVVTVDVPGYDRKEIDIVVLDHRLRIAAQHDEMTEIDEEDYLRHERRHESMRRTIQLPDEVDPDSVSAKLHNGVLTITLPKQMIEEARTVEIQ